MRLSLFYSEVIYRLARIYGNNRSSDLSHCQFVFPLSYAIAVQIPLCPDEQARYFFPMAYLALIRIGNFVFVGLSTIAGYFLTHGVDWSGALLPAFVVALSLAGGNALNDFFDITADKISHPKRPLVRGEVKPIYAVWIVMFCWVSSAVISFFISPIHVAVALAAQTLLFLYSAFLSGLPLVGNFVVGTLGATAVLYATLPLPSTQTIGASVIAGILNLTREIFKDIDDREGDVSAGRRTLPIIAKPSTALHLARTTGFISAIIILTIAFILPYGLPFKIGSMLTAAITIISVLLHKRSSATLKFAMFVGIVSIFAEVYLG